MGYFATQLKSVDLDGRWFQLLEDSIYVDDNGMRHTVPAGFISDGSSVPRGLWNIVPPKGRAKQPGVHHDFDYWIGKNRKQADKMYRRMLKARAFNFFVRWAAYRGLRLFAGKHWNVKSVIVWRDGEKFTKRGKKYFMPLLKENYRV